MISFPTSARIMVAAKPVDFRRGGESLAALAREVLKEDPFAGVIVIFRSRRAHHPTFCIRSTIWEDRLPVSSVLRPSSSNISEQARSRPSVCLHG
jgi:hypothetical protein